MRFPNSAGISKNSVLGEIRDPGMRVRIPCVVRSRFLEPAVDSDAYFGLIGTITDRTRAHKAK